MASLPRALIRPARHVLNRSAFCAPRTLAVRGMATVGNAPPMEPHKERSGEMAVGELEGATFTIQPLRRVGEDEKTMRARLVYQSRKRGILETDLLLSTFADQYLPAMSQEQMAQYDLFLDENDWDIYYWATQEEPSSHTNPSSSSSPAAAAEPASPMSTSTFTSTSSAAETDTSSASYGSGSETVVATSGSESTSTGGSPLTGEHGDTKPYTSTTTTTTTTTPTSAPAPAPYVGEWAQTVGTFKPAYRPVPIRWQDSDILKLVREHVRARAGQKGGMAFMPALRS
ncbi:Flavinator of succinate dehydrogenase-domain-containing protein [Astrocystis sublimbata]|nr:Flavinator of succinate dehydrogenase-domain-containing protein [Astrocystis sublimbata]